MKLATVSTKNEGSEAGWTILKTWLFKVICSALLFWKSHLWKSFIYDLPKGIMKFMVNAFLDILPTKNNLCRWGERINTKCTLCGNKETLQHVLNNSNTILDQGRYTNLYAFYICR